MSKRKYTDEQFIQAVKESFSVREALKKLGLSPTGGSYKLFVKRCKMLNLDTSHFTGKGHLKNKTHNWAPKIDLSLILVEDSHYNSNSLRKRLIKENYFKYQCCDCLLSEWRGEPIRLELEHINGVNTDNRIENLKILCPNCHSLTDTYRGKNKKKK
jgi:hypothetical protein